MKKFDSKKKQMVQLFKYSKCITLEDLSSSLNYSGRSVQRLLKSVGYYSSITHNGKWYTLHDIPKFDNNGLWFHQKIGFSKLLDLNTTIFHLIDNSAGGLTATKLSKMLSTSCSPILNRLHKANKIDRVKTHKDFVYISVDQSIKERQIANIETTRPLKLPSDTDTINILVEFIKNPNRTLEELVSCLKQEGISCSAENIKNLFVYLGLEKKIPKIAKISS